VFASPLACRELLQRLSEMTEHDINARWSAWKGQEPPPHGPRVGEQIPIEVQLAMLQADCDSYRQIVNIQVRELAAVVEVHPMQLSYVELIASVRRSLKISETGSSTWRLTGRAAVRAFVSRAAARTRVR